MGIWLIVILWLLFVAPLVRAICAAAARPIPAPGDTQAMKPQ